MLYCSVRLHGDDVTTSVDSFMKPRAKVVHHGLASEGRGCFGVEGGGG